MGFSKVLSLLSLDLINHNETAVIQRKKTKLVMGTPEKNL